MKRLGIVGENEYSIIKEAYDSIKKKMPYKPQVALVLGTGLGDFAEKLKIDKEIVFDEIKHFPKTTNKVHRGRFIFSHIGDVKIVCMQGRIHYYEGYSPYETVRPIRLLKLMGIETIILTNAAGGINKSYKVGDLMLIKDHISFFVENPLRGKNVDELGERFVDMTDPYDKDIRKVVKGVAKQNNIGIKEGIYVQTLGPTFETASEIKLLSKLGADAVAMSLCVETIAARHAGMKVCGISMITNKATGLAKEKHSDEKVRLMAVKNAKKLETLLYKIIPKLA